MTAQTFRLPDVGEGLTEAEILDWRVAVGDTVAVNQILVEIETAKAAVELPSPFAGRVTALLADAGATVAVGAPIISIEDGVAGSGPAPDEPVGTKIGEVTADGKIATLVGYVPASGPTARRPRRPAAARGCRRRPADELPAARPARLRPPPVGARGRRGHRPAPAVAALSRPACAAGLRDGIQRAGARPDTRCDEAAGCRLASATLKSVLIRVILYSGRA